MSDMPSSLDALLQSPVEHVRLGDYVEIANSGVDKKSVDGQVPVRLLNFLDVYRNRQITSEVLTAVTTAPAAKAESANLVGGDVVVTPTSESIDDLAHAAVVEEDLVEAVYSYHVMRLRPNRTAFESAFLAYLFRSGPIQDQIQRAATGITRFGLTRSRWEELRLPMPPLEVQRDVVRILDQFTELESELKGELEAELEARRAQFAHYRAAALDFSDAAIDYLPMGEVVEIRSGWGFPNAYQGQKSGRYPFYKVSDMNSPGNETKLDVANHYIDEDTAKRLGVKPAPPGTIVFPKIGAAVATNKKRILSRTAAYDNNVMGLIPGPKVLSRFLFHWMQDFDLSTLAYNSGAVPSIRKTEVTEVLMPVPAAGEQQRIVEMLDKFDALVHDFAMALPAELAARRKQYEYYRDKLLTFEEAPA